MEKTNPIIGNCALCKKPINSQDLIFELDLNKLYCLRCHDLIYTCYNCEYGKSCEFETNSSTLPKMVQAQMRQGNAVMIQTIKNPERIKITCENGCKCWNAEECVCVKEESVNCRFCLTHNWRERNE
jgi:hypothetical protein